MRSGAALALLLLSVAVSSCGRKSASNAQGAAAPARAAAAAPSPSPPTPAPPIPLEDAEERQGPFTIGNQPFTVVLHSRRLPGRSDPDSQSLTWIEIRDGAGRAQYREAFTSTIENGTFAESCAANAMALKGSMGSGVLLAVDCLPSAPSSGGPWAVFGVVGGSLKRFGTPLVADGQLGAFTPGAIDRIGTVTRTLADMLTVRLWTGYFFVSVPIRVDWQSGALVPGQRCMEQTGRGFAETGCEWTAEEAQPAPRDQQTFVRLFREATEASGPPAHVVVNPSSMVAVVAGKVRVIWDPGPEVTSLSADDDIWVRVRIDGRDGWIHTSEDLEAIGLSRAG